MAARDEITVKLAETAAEREGAFQVRLRVFVAEQGIPASEELDSADAAATHAIAVFGDEVIATGRMLVVAGDPAGVCRIGRMAVAPEWRRAGVGGLILNRLEAAARAQGMRRCLLHAQEYVKSFYANHGYQEQGETFLEVDIPHIEMVKDL